MAPIHLFTKQIASTFMASTIIDLKLVDIHGTSLPYAPYKCPALFHGLAEVYVNPFKVSFYAFTLFSNN